MAVSLPFSSVRIAIHCKKYACIKCFAPSFPYFERNRFRICLVSVNRRNNEVRARTGMWARASLRWHSTTPTLTPDTDILVDILARIVARCRRLVQLATGITSGNRECQTCRRGSSRGCPCQCRCPYGRRGMPALRLRTT